MTREQKVEKKKAKRNLRFLKRKAKNQSYISVMRRNDLRGISQGRRRANGSLFSCEMAYQECILRGFCNGDC